MSLSTHPFLHLLIALIVVQSVISIILFLGFRIFSDCLLHRCQHRFGKCFYFMCCLCLVGYYEFVVVLVDLESYFSIRLHLAFILMFTSRLSVRLSLKYLMV